MSSFSLKVLACICMFIDHIGFALFPKIKILRAIGRMAFPIFAYQISIGFEKTKSKEKYILRMLLFAIISQIPFFLMRKLSLSYFKPVLNIGATLTFGLLCLYIIDKIKIPFLKYISIMSIILISILIPIDYSWYGVLIIIAFYIFRNEKLGMGIFYPCILASYCFFRKSTFNIPAILALIPIFLYNGKKGKDAKYLFYAFYPLHILLIVLIKLKF